MTAPATVQVSITPEAAKRAAELGLQTELDQIIEHARQTVPGLRLLEVTLREPYDMDEESGVRIDSFWEGPIPSNGPIENPWNRWLIATFPPRVLEHISTLFHRETGHAG